MHTEHNCSDQNIRVLDCNRFGIVYKYITHSENLYLIIFYDIEGVDNTHLYIAHPWSSPNFFQILELLHTPNSIIPVRAE